MVTPEEPVSSASMIRQTPEVLTTDAADYVILRNSIWVEHPANCGQQWGYTTPTPQIKNMVGRNIPCPRANTWGGDAG
jgi:hypothetical protein